MQIDRDCPHGYQCRRAFRSVQAALPVSACQTLSLARAALLAVRLLQSDGKSTFLWKRGSCCGPGAWQLPGARPTPAWSASALMGPRSSAQAHVSATVIIAQSLDGGRAVLVQDLTPTTWSHAASKATARFSCCFTRPLFFYLPPRPG